MSEHSPSTDANAISDILLGRLRTIAGELAKITCREQPVDLLSLVHSYIQDAQAEGILPVRTSGELTDADCELMYEYLHYQAILASYAASNKARDVYAEAHGHICRASTAETPDRAYMHLRLAITAVEMLARGVRHTQAAETAAADIAAAGGVRQ